MSISDSTVKGKFDEVAGKVKQAFGEGTDNQKVANEGAAQEVKGHAEQAWGGVKEATQDKVDDYKARHAGEAEQHGHDIREKITSTAQNVKDSVLHAVKGDDRAA
ncbi:CsbD family protein [Granulicella cerasi]|uniref:CsbD family protein n=1 Tax=Granulicella cerasi TaxID=741063 RepID=A0ABW1ZDQ1_9BACT|nr:CsbD family protein [Granulicella cerasi]